MQEPFGEAGQVVHLRQDLGSELGIALGEHLDARSHERERRAELVRRVGGEARLGLVRSFHRMDRPRRQPPPGPHADEHRQPAGQQEEEAKSMNETLLGQE